LITLRAIAAFKEAVSSHLIVPFNTLKAGRFTIIAALTMSGAIVQFSLTAAANVL